MQKKVDEAAPAIQAARPVKLAYIPALLLAAAGCSSASSGPLSQTSDAGGNPFPASDASFDTLAPDAGPDAAPETSLDSAVADSAVDAAPADAPATTHANGMLGAWQAMISMPLPRGNHCAVVAAGYLVVIGGNYVPAGGSSFVNTDAVHVAALQADGSLGPWSQAGTAPSPVNSCTATAKGSTIYLVDGIYDDPTKGGQLWTTDLSSAGVLGAWTSQGPLPNGQDALYSDAWVGTDAASTLYAMDGNLNGNVISALHVPLAPQIGTWTEDDFQPGFLGHPAYAFTGAYIYTLGGYSSDDAGDLPVGAAVSAAPIGSNGAVGSSFNTQALPSPVAFAKAVAVDGWLFVIGGKDMVFASGKPDASSSQIGAGGQLGAWTTQTPLPQGRTSHALALAGDFLYVTGGGFDGPGLNTVFASRVRF